MKMWLIPHEEDYRAICENLESDIEDCLIGINQTSNISYFVTNNEPTAKAMCELTSIPLPLIELDIKAKSIVKSVNEIM